MTYIWHIYIYMRQNLEFFDSLSTRIWSYLGDVFPQTVKIDAMHCDAQMERFGHHQLKSTKQRSLSCPALSFGYMGQYLQATKNQNHGPMWKKQNSYKQCPWKKDSLPENLWNCNEPLRAPRHLHLQDSEQGRPDGKIEHQGTSKTCKFRNKYRNVAPPDKFAHLSW